MTDETAVDKTETTDTQSATDKVATADNLPNQTMLDGAKADVAIDAKAEDAPAQKDWRDLASGGDAKFRKQLDRMADLEALGRSFRESQRKLSSGEYKKALPDGATEQEVATWRKENGIPENADGYIGALALPDGVVLGEADKPIALAFADAALKSNVTPSQYSHLVSAYYQMQDEQAKQIADADAKFQMQSEESLRETWGNDYRRNLTAVNNLIAGWPKELSDGVLAGRSPDGRKLGDNPKFIQQLAHLAMELNPAASLVPAGSSNPLKSAESRLEEIRAIRRKDMDAYDNNKAMQAEELQLLEAVQKIKGRNAA